MALKPYQERTAMFEGFKPNAYLDRMGYQTIGFGESVPDETLKVDELAAYTAVASMLMNLDEVINRE